MENTLAHHGILGMKWGVRRTPAQLGRKDAKQLTKLTKSIRIKAGNEKRSLEKQINERMKDPKYRQSFNKTMKELDTNKQLKKLAKESRQKVANTVAQTITTTSLNAMTGQYGRDIFTEAITPTVRKMQTDALIKSLLR